MIRLLCIAFCCAFCLTPAALSQTVSPQERAIIQAFSQGDRAQTMDRVAELVAMIDAGWRHPERSRTAIYGVLAEISFSIGAGLDKSLQLYQRGLDAALQDEDLMTRDGLELRYQMMSALQIADRHEEARDLGYSILRDITGLGPAYMQLEALVRSNLGGIFTMQENWTSAEVEFRQALSIALRMDDPDNTVALAAGSGLTELLLNNGRFDEALPIAKNMAELAVGLHSATSESGIIARFRYAMALFEAGETELAQIRLGRILADAERVLPASHPVSIGTKSILARIQSDGGQYLASRALRSEALNAELSSLPDQQQLVFMRQRASQLYGARQFDAYERAMLDLIVFVRASPTLPGHHMAIAGVELARFSVDIRGDFDTAYQHLSYALPSLRETLGPDHIETLRAEAEWIHLRRTEADTADIWRATKRSPVFWDGTAQGAAISVRDIEAFKRLAAAEAQSGSRVSSVMAHLNLASMYGDAGQYADALGVLKGQLEFLTQERDAGRPIPVDMDFLVIQTIGSTFFKGRRYDLAVETYRNGVDEVLAMLRNSRWLSALDGSDVFHQQGQLFGQDYSTSIWYADKHDGHDDSSKWIELAFEAVQLAGYGPAASAVSRASVRRGAKDPDLVTLVTEWEQLSNFRPETTRLDATSNETGDRRKYGDRLSALRLEISERFPEYFRLQVPQPVPLADVLGADGQRGFLRDDEALILILPTLGLSVQKERLEGLVIAVTDKGTAWAEITQPWDQMAYDIQALHTSLDPEGAAMARAPLAALSPETVSGSPNKTINPFAFGPAKRLYETFFGNSKIARLIEAKQNWVIVPFGATLSVPFSALVTDDHGQWIYNNAEDFRNVGWLGHERAITVAPSVTAVADLRLRQENEDLGSQIAYVGFGDPLFEGAVGNDPVQTAAILRGSSQDRSNGLRALPRLPGTKREVEALAQHFGAVPKRAILGAQASETHLRELNSSGVLAQTKVLHFATHGLLAGAFEGLSEPALALTPPVDAHSGDGIDGLLTASEAARLNLNADWVILSACDTAGQEGISGDGLGGLVQGFFYAGAQSLLVSHWRVDDRAAAWLTTRTVTQARNGVTKAEALRRAMKDLAADRSQDNSALPNAHPSIWAPFLLLGGG